jgi:hypothetical protein
MGMVPYNSGDYVIEFGGDRSLWIDSEKVASSCSFSSVKVEGIPITTDTYTWIEGSNEVYSLVITGETMTMTVAIDQVVNGIFSKFARPAPP